MDQIHKQLHAVESQIIEINGLLKALQRLVPDDAASICVMNALDEKVGILRELFYSHWKSTYGE